MNGPLRCSLRKANERFNLGINFLYHFYGSIPCLAHGKFCQFLKYFLTIGTVSSTNDGTQAVGCIHSSHSIMGLGAQSFDTMGLT